MATFLTLWNWTDQGRSNFKDTVNRVDAFKKMAAKLGGKVQSFYWTVGAYDGMCLMDAPDEETAVAILVKLGGVGNIRTQTFRAYDAKAMAAILAKAEAAG